MQQCRVLIVDDQRDVRRMLRAALETMGAGVSVTDVPSGEEAILVISRQPVDLLVSDVRLPGISGLELIERTRVRNPALRLILITGMTDDATHRQLEKARADAYFFKPIHLEEFLSAVQRLMAVGSEAEAPAAPPPVEAAPPPAVAEGSAPPPPAPAPAETLPGASAVQRILAELRQKLSATLAGLVNRQGDVVELDGAVSAEIDEWVGVLRITSGFSETGGEIANTLIFTPGRMFDFWLTSAAPGLALVIGAPHRRWDENEFGELAAALWAAAADLRAIAPALHAVRANREEPADEPAGLGSLDALFEKLDAGQLPAQDAGAFWDLAAENHSLPGEREGGLTYDEARRLGLAPDED